MNRVVGSANSPCPSSLIEWEIAYKYTFNSNKLSLWVFHSCYVIECSRTVSTLLQSCILALLYILDRVFFSSHVSLFDYVAVTHYKCHRRPPPLLPLPPSPSTRTTQFIRSARDANFFLSTFAATAIPFRRMHKNSKPFDREKEEWSWGGEWRWWWLMVVEEVKYRMRCVSSVSTTSKQNEYYDYMKYPFRNSSLPRAIASLPCISGWCMLCMDSSMCVCSLLIVAYFPVRGEQSIIV